MKITYVPKHKQFKHKINFLKFLFKLNKQLSLTKLNLIVLNHCLIKTKKNFLSLLIK